MNTYSFVILFYVFSKHDNYSYIYNNYILIFILIMLNSYFISDILAHNVSLA